MSVALKCTFSIPVNNDEFVVLIDKDQGASVTNDANNVISWLVENLDNGLGERKVYYRDTTGSYDEMEHEKGVFVSFSACPSHVKEALAAMVAKVSPES
ncbi:hypothetical protein ACLI07_23750 (plasmid) [Providencia huaxiensis]|uniref:Uncharacterized protein n=4 Tax=Enterobacterales TaxID=91347 RepID=A0AA42FJA9_9GAMM|nr:MULTISPECIES: hypothetical protein [Enterobacterales]ELB1214748.1 hypothetical protein [Proteus mirabilis]ELY4881573.1 hypothetical protein [Morganella morganii]SPY66423.1 Uncharacterised protein [Providencia stuartii]HAZ7869397.1 hypothetical protein [Escherichia coli]ELR5094375.1 hypothetical protein [Providencia rettgeri]